MQPLEAEAVAVLRELHELLDFTNGLAPGECQMGEACRQRLNSAFARALLVIRRADGTLPERPEDMEVMR